jgi:hypothetical protein
MQAMIANERQKELNESRLEATMSTLESYGGFGGSPIPMASASLSRASNVEVPTSSGSLASGTVNVTQPGNNKSDKKLSISRSADDYTQLPVEMDRKFEALDVDGMNSEEDEST